MSAETQKRQPLYQNLVSQLTCDQQPSFAAGILKTNELSLRLNIKR
jgi:hypothetical protein